VRVFTGSTTDTSLLGESLHLAVFVLDVFSAILERRPSPEVVTEFHGGFSSFGFCFSRDKLFFDGNKMGG